jgi:hypothetical protein
LKAALDVERVTKRFYREFQQQHLDFLALIEGIADERQRRWYASVLLNRLMFIYFLQRKHFLDMTQGGASHLVTSEPVKNKTSAILYEGKMIWQFDHALSEPKLWINPGELRKFLLRKGGDNNIAISADSYRLAFRRQSASTNERTLITTVLPPCFHADNLASVVVFDDAGNRLLTNTYQLFLCAVLNSYVVDYFVRQRVTNNLNFFYLYQLPVPRITEKAPAFAAIVSRAAKLICTTPEFDDLAREIGLGSHKNGVTDTAERAKLRQELDGLVAHLYGLTEEEFAYILTTFPLVAEPEKNATIAAFRALAPKPGDPEISALVAAGESAKLEFKSSARWDLRENKKNPIMEQVILKTVAAFLNTEGGTLLLGVSDDGVALGLEYDYQTLHEKNADGYELFLSDLLLNHYGKDCSPCVSISFHQPEGKQICRVDAKPASRSVWVKEGGEEHLYIRSGNSTRRLTTREATNYCKTRWP